MQLLPGTNFLAFFLFLFDNFSLLDPDPGVKINVDPDPQPWFIQIERGERTFRLTILVSHKWSIYILTFGWFGLSEEFCRPDQTPAGFPFKLAVLL